MVDALREPLQKLLDWRFFRYFFASATALAFDVGTFLILLSLGVFAAGASAAGYSLGIVVHWFISSRAVFIGNVADPGLARTRQKALFIIAALIGLGLTTAIVWAGDASGIDPRVAKLFAIGVSFFSVWLLRSRVVFR